MILSRIALLLALPLAGCITSMERDPVAQHPDHRIVVAPAAPGSRVLKAYAPECPAWTRHRPDVDDNMPQPQIGCANQRNLALSIADPTDLVGGRGLSEQDATLSAAAVQRYHEGKTRGLYDPQNPPGPKE